MVRHSFRKRILLRKQRQKSRMIGGMPIIEIKGQEVFWDGRKKYLVDSQGQLFQILPAPTRGGPWTVEKWKGAPAPEEDQTVFNEYLSALSSSSVPQDISEVPQVAPEIPNETQPFAPEVPYEVPQVAPEVPYEVPQVAPEVPYEVPQVAPEVPYEVLEIPYEVTQVAPEPNPCPQLYDPCTKEPLPNMQVLEKRIREIKKQQDTVPTGLYGLTSDTSNYDFLTNVFINPTISLDDMVNFRLYNQAQIGSDIYEVLSRLFVLFGGIENVNPGPGGNYKFMQKIEGSRIYEDTVDALKQMKCKASNVMGVSDITLVNVKDFARTVKPDDPYCEVSCDTTDTTVVKTYLMSVKWYKKEKSGEHYDLEKLFVAAQKVTTMEQRPLDIIVFLKSKKDFEIAHNRAFRQYSRELAKTFFGWNEDVKPFLEEKRRTLFETAREMGITPLQALEMQYLQPSAKPVLSLQLHQDIIVKGVCDNIDADDDNLYLVGVLPRGGKTFIAGGIIREFLRRKSPPNLNIFWLTAAPNETLAQVRDELLNRFHDFIHFDFVEVKSMNDLRKTKPHTVFFCSTQLLLVTEKQSDKKRRDDFLKLLRGEDRLGMVFFDEAHKTGTGEQTKKEITNIINTYSQANLPFIFLTATYYNLLFDYQIHKKNTFIWDYTDVLSARALATDSEQTAALNNLKTRFGEELVESILQKRMANNESFETMAKAYIGFPDLYFVSADFQKEALDRFATQNIYRPDSGFGLSSIFALKQGASILDIKTPENKIRKDAYRIFDNLTNPKNLISLITPKETFGEEMAGTEGGEPLAKEEGSPLEPSLLGRIHKMSSDTKSRFRLDERPTMLMFLPTGGTGTNIFYLLCAWASLLMTHTWWRENYEIACVVSDETLGSTDVASLLEMDLQASESIHIITKNPKSSIMALERRLHCEKGKGLLVLAGEKLSMGISLPCTDVVFLLNEKKSPDDIIQKMYRALTPSPGKKAAFIVDLNPVRTLAALYGYTRASHENVNTSTEILDILYDTYTWDADIFEYSLRKGADSLPLTFQDRLRQLFEMAEKDTENVYRINEDIGGFEKKLAANVRKGMNSTFIAGLRNQIGTRRMDAMLGSIGLREGSQFSLNNGMLVIRSPPLELSSDQPEPEPGKIEIQIENFIETLADFIKYLALTSNADTLEGALQEYQQNIVNSEGTSLQQNVIRMIRSRTDVREGADKTILSKLLVAAINNFALPSSSEIFRQMRGKVDDNEIKKDKILSIIHKRLTPRHKQRKEAGEVFTPLHLIEKVMNHLPSSVWKNPNLKWIDPANGIGNFPVYVFYRLDEELKSWEPNDKKRRRHIIENMLYMVELQSNNNRIARKIFTSLCDGCNPNILTANSVQLNSEKLKAKGFPEKFDIVMGNPPFQNGRNMMFYVYFIDLANRIIKDGGHLVYVIPNKILIPNKANESIKQFNPYFIYHTVNQDFLPTVISTTICGVICKKEPFTNQTVVQFSNGEMNVDLNTPTPTQYNDIYLKKLSDKILFGNNRHYFTVHKNKPPVESLYISRVWMRYSPDKPAGGSHVFRISPDPLQGDDGSGRYVEIPPGMTKEMVTWFLSRSKLMRFITKVYAGAMNVPAFLWDILPLIPLTSMSDAEVYSLMNMNTDEQQIIQTSLNDAIEEVELGETLEGGSRRRRTFKKRRV